jgi:hypothetical protein
MNSDELHQMLRDGLSDVLKDIKSVEARLRSTVEVGQMIKLEEIGPKSFVQLIEYIPVQANGPKEPYLWTYKYHQYWVDQCPQNMQDKLIGGFLGERIGQSKVFGIYEIAKKS